MISIGEQNVPLVYSVPMDNTIDETDNELDIFYLAFGTLRRVLMQTNESMKRACLPNTNFR